MAIKFRLRTLFIVTTVVALIAFVGVVLVRLNRAVDVMIWKGYYLEGNVTREEARKALGDVVDTWPEPQTGQHQ